MKEFWFAFAPLMLIFLMIIAELFSQHSISSGEWGVMSLLCTLYWFAMDEYRK